VSIILYKSQFYKCNLLGNVTSLQGSSVTAARPVSLPKVYKMVQRTYRQVEPYPLRYQGRQRNLIQVYTREREVTRNLTR